MGWMRCVIAWGSNDARESTVPAAARHGVSAIAAGGSYSLALKNGEVIAWGGAGTTLAATIEALTEEAEIITIVEGEGAPIALDDVAALAPESVEAEAHRGGQPHYWWLLAAQ